MRNFNGPNLLTGLRVLMSPLLWWAMFAGLPLAVPCAIFLAAAATDLFDGWWARKSNTVTSFGKIADPIADKALTGVAWIGLSVLGQISWIATVAILVREIGITLLRLRVVQTYVLPASRGGKLKTTLQITTIGCLLAAGNHAIAAINFVTGTLLWATVLVTVWTGLEYLRELIPALKQAR